MKTRYPLVLYIADRPRHRGAGRSPGAGPGRRSAPRPRIRHAVPSHAARNRRRQRSGMPRNPGQPRLRRDAADRARAANASLSAPAAERPSFRIEQRRRCGRCRATCRSRWRPAGRRSEEHRARRGARRWLAQTLYEYAAPLFDDEGKVRGAVGAFLDITELKLRRGPAAPARARERAALSPGAGGQPAEGRVPRDAFARAADAAQCAARLDSPAQVRPAVTGEAQRALAAIERSAQLQAQLTSDLLDVSGVITGKLRLQLEPTRLSADHRRRARGAPAGGDVQGMHCHLP